MGASTVPARRIRLTEKACFPGSLATTSPLLPDATITFLGSAAPSAQERGGGRYKWSNKTRVHSPYSKLIRNKRKTPKGAPVQDHKQQAEKRCARRGRRKSSQKQWTPVARRDTPTQVHTLRPPSSSTNVRCFPRSRSPCFLSWFGSLLPLVLVLNT